MEPQTPALRPAQRTPEKQLVYVFDAAGKFLASYATVTLCAEKLALGRPTVNAGLQRGSMVASRYYISYEKEFKATKFKQSHNPLAERSSRTHAPMPGLHEQDFFEVIY